MGDVTLGFQFLVELLHRVVCRRFADSQDFHDIFNHEHLAGLWCFGVAIVHVSHPLRFVEKVTPYWPCLLYNHNIEMAATIGPKGSGSFSAELDRDLGIECPSVFPIRLLPDLPAQLQIIVNGRVEHGLKLLYGLTIKYQRVGDPENLPIKVSSSGLYSTFAW